MECIMRNALTSDFILVIDTDEYPMVDWSQPAPLDGFKEFMRNIPATIGSISFERQDPRPWWVSGWAFPVCWTGKPER